MPHVQCLQCATWFYRDSADIVPSGRVFCSRQCANHARPGAEPRIESPCLQCGLVMIVSPKLLKKGLGKYCSRTCLNIYEQLHGRTTRRLGKALPTAERFWTFVDKTETCWLWTGAKDRKGYGSFGFGGNSHISAHRFAYESTYGLILHHDICICHSCDNPSCVRPDHLFLGTQKDNIADAMAKGRFRGGKKKGLHNT